MLQVAACEFKCILRFAASPCRGHAHAFLLPGTNEDKVRLASLVDETAHARMKLCRKELPRRPATQNSSGLWLCRYCGEFKNESDFHKRSAASNGLQSNCMQCCAKYDLQRSDTLRRRMQHNVSNARGSAQRRLSKGRVSAGVCNLSFEDLLSIWQRHEGRCAYSGVVLQFRSCHHWQCSLERVNPDCGYTHDNVCFIAAEFQTVQQWSRKKVESLSRLRDRARKADSPSLYNEIGLTCFRRLLQNARNAARARAARGRSVAGYFALDLAYLCDLFVQQRGLCFYSGVPMVTERGREWSISLERLDNMHGYVEGNVALICREFQSSDYSLKISPRRVIHGSPQWSRDKFEGMLDFTIAPAVSAWRPRALRS